MTSLRTHLRPLVIACLLLPVAHLHAQAGGAAQTVLTQKATEGSQGAQPQRPQQGVAGAPTGGDGVPGVPARSPAPGRPRIGLALGGGGALALSEIGVLRWMEENHVPVDVIAGTSMGSLIGALYSTGHTPDQMAELTSDRVFSQVFRIGHDFKQVNFRRREDQRFLPGGFNVGLKHGVSLRNGVLLDYGLNGFLNAQFLPYGAATRFDDMPLPFRCVATDILVGREAVFTQGVLAEAVRASISIPGVFPPLEDGGHIYVDGALTENLPTDLVKHELHADVVLAVSLPLTPPAPGDTGSVLGILQRSFSVASWSNEVRSRALADVIVEPTAPPGVGAGDYSRSEDLAKAGYVAAEKMRAQLIRYRLSDADWESYLALRTSRQPRAVRNIATVRVIAPDKSTVQAVSALAMPIAGKKLNLDNIDAVTTELRSDGRFDAVYFLSTPGQVLNTDVTGPANVGRSVAGREIMHPEEKRGPGDDTAAQFAGGAAGSDTQSGTVTGGQQSNQAGGANAKETYETVAPSSKGKIVTADLMPRGYQVAPGDVDLNLWVHDRGEGPPFLLIGGNVIAQTGGTARATVDAVVTNQDLGGYGSELRTRVRYGFLTELTSEYYRLLTPRGLFVAPRLMFYRAPEYIYADQKRVAQRLSQVAGGGLDMGFTLSHSTEVRAGWQQIVQRWATTTGNDQRPAFSGSSQLVRAQYRYNGQDRAMVPRRGLRVDASAGYLFGSNGSADAPRIEASGAYFRDIGHGNTVSFSAEGGTLFNRAVVDPFRFTLGGPLRLSASAYNENRGTDYVFLRPAYFRRIADLPQVLGQSIYVVGTYEWGQVRAPDLGTVTRQDVFFGLAAETPLGAITFGPAFGDHDHRKIVFTLGRFF